MEDFSENEDEVAAGEDNFTAECLKLGLILFVLVQLLAALASKDNSPRLQYCEGDDLIQDRPSLRTTGHTPRPQIQGA